MHVTSANARAHVTVTVVSEDQADAQTYCVPGTASDRLAMVWPLTPEVLAFAGYVDAEVRLARSVVRVRPLQG